MNEAETQNSSIPAIRRCLAALLVALAGPQLAQAQPAAATTDAEEPEAKQEQPVASYFDSTTVTATGSERSVFQVATPVTVVEKAEIERIEPDNAADLLRDQPGVDVNGVGPNQARPVIRGQRGLRVLFLEDGLRLNNARRQTDFGEITGLVDLDSIDAVEVVRGPASVLYGSDAIGGVLNLVTGRPRFDGDRRFAGTADVRYGSAAEMRRFGASAAGVRKKLDYQVGAMNRSSSDYEAPSGRFGAVRLAEDATVLDTGLDDRSFWGSVGYEVNDRHSLRLRYNRYRADQTGFGFVDPSDYAPEEDRIRIFYPYQRFDRLALYYQGSVPGCRLADSIDFKAYRQTNERQLANDIVAREPDFGPFGVIDIDTLGTTDLETNGLRLEAIRSLTPDHLLTWGLEGFRDDSKNSDFLHISGGLRFPFPPFDVIFFEATDDKANAPNARNTSWGAFAQDEWTVSEKLRVTGGMRYQKVSTRAEPTPQWEIAGLDFDDDAVVGSATATWQLLPELNALASFGTAFRAPNIIERLFNGVTPEGNGYQILNPDLSSEKSRNVDIGLKYRRRNAFLELVAFRTYIRDGIVQHFLSEAEIAALPDDLRAAIAASGVDDVVQQRNADRLRYKGVELAIGYRAPVGITVGGNYTHLSAERIDSANPPTGDTYGDKLTAYVRYEPEEHPFWIEYRVRHNDSTDANLDPTLPVPPVGTTLPGFTVHSLAAGGTLYRHGSFAHEIRVALENLTDELYAEFSNASFFRPEPGRSLNASYRLRF